MREGKQIITSGAIGLTIVGPERGEHVSQFD
jgi:hypothetical protein